MLESCRREMGEEKTNRRPSPQIIYTAAEWLTSRSQPSARRRAPLAFRTGAAILS